MGRWPVRTHGDGTDEIYKVPWEEVIKEPVYIQLDCTLAAAHSMPCFTASLPGGLSPPERARPSGAIAGCHLSAVWLVSRIAEPAPEVG